MRFDAILMKTVLHIEPSDIYVPIFELRQDAYWRMHFWESCNFLKLKLQLKQQKGCLKLGLMYLKITFTLTKGEILIPIADGGFQKL